MMKFTHCLGLLVALVHGGSGLEAPSILISRDASADAVLDQLAVGVKLFSNRDYTMVECPEELAGKSFVRTSIAGTLFQCTEPGVIAVYTPNPANNADSIATNLIAQGFLRNSQPSFQLMLSGAANTVEGYEKTLEQGEWVEIPKWGIVTGVGSMAIQPSLAAIPAQVITNPSPKYSSSARRFQGIPSMAVAPSGRLWTVWYGGVGPTEDEFNYVIAATSSDGGTTWSDEKLVVDPDGVGTVRAFDPQAWVDPNGTLWIIWAQTIGHDSSVAGTWAITTDQPDAENPVWSDPVRLTDGIMMGKPIVLTTGEWVLPAAVWGADNSCRMVVSSDQGASWQLRGAANVPSEYRNADEHMLVERLDGSLWMWIRTDYGIGESSSSDRGVTWSAVVPSDVQHTVSRFFIWRLASGNLLLVKHGGIDEDVGRTDLTAFISKDDGETWEGGLLLDDRAAISYPDGMQDADGAIYITYDRRRTTEREILMARFTEAEVESGTLTAANSALRLLVNKATYETLVFSETFTNPDPDAPLANIDWHANIGLDGMSVDTNNKGSVGPILSVSDYIFYRMGSSDVPVLSWTDKDDVDCIGPIGYVDTVSLKLRNDDAAEDLKVALKVNGSWFVSQAVLNGTANAVVSLDVQSAAWNSLDFVPDSQLVEGGAAALPAAGAVQAIGIFDAASTSGSAVRIDNVTVETVP